MKTYHGSSNLRNIIVDEETGLKDLAAGIGIQVKVEFQSGGDAVIYDLNGVEKANPTITDSNGNYEFAVEDGVYKIIIGTGSQQVTLESVEIAEVKETGIPQRYGIPVSAGQTVLQSPVDVEDCVLVIDGSVQMFTATPPPYSINTATNEITVPPLVGTEKVEVWTNPAVASGVEKRVFKTLEDFGAVGDGITDDSAAINAALNSGNPIIGASGARYAYSQQILIPDGCHFDGMGCEFVWSGTAGAPTFEGRDWGTFSALGSVDAQIDSHEIISDIPEFTESDYPVGNQNNFTISEGDYIFVVAGSTSTRPELPAYALMTKYLGITSPQRVALDYRSGWTIPSGEGLFITYNRITPRKNIKLKNFTITDESPDSGDLNDYASGISLAYAHDCHIENVSGVGMRNPVVFTLYCTDCSVIDGHVDTPKITTGGRGYHTQWSYALRCKTQDVTGVKARHIVDHTKSAYCEVINCGDTNSADGAFTNHGSYEHDISYYNCTGYHSVANSGVVFGESAKRINIVGGNGVFLAAGRNVIDLSVRDSTFERVLANSQGFQADGLTVGDNGFSLVSSTTALGRDTLSSRPNVISNSSIIMGSGQVLTDFNFTGRTLYINNTDIRGVNSSVIGTGKVKMTGGSLTGTTAAIEFGSDASLELYNVDTTSLGMRSQDGSGNSSFIIDGGTHTNIVSTGLYSSRTTSANDGGPIKLEIRNVDIDGGGGIIIDMPSVTAPNNNFIDISHNSLSNGSINISNIYSGAGKLVYTNNLEDTVTRTTDTTGGRRLIENNITV